MIDSEIMLSDPIHIFSPNPFILITEIQINFFFLAKGLSINSDLGHDEAQFQWLRYQLDSRVKWLERWQTCSASLRTAFMFGQKLKSDHG